MSAPIAGELQISNDVLADLAGYAALEVYGVVGMTTPSLKNGVAQILSKDKLRRGIQVASEGGIATVDLYVVVEHGTNITEVSHNLKARVRYVLESIAGVEVADVPVHVQGIKVRT
ncbi:MAG: Asp23/Gls24 family envelope stress response protein [Actinobacteria bacterium]|nr:MAG: Asp23/Gls24 family envelope stress response protein [Actinomycetota bacterium]